MPESELSEADYLREVERLAREVVDAALREGWLAYSDEPADATRLQRAVNELARSIRHYHFQGDGCLDEEAGRGRVRLAGVLLLRPDVMPSGADRTYEQVCGELGVDARPEGWALWNTWGKDGSPATMIVTNVEGTEGLLANWSRGISIYPVTPLPAQIALTRRGWVEPMTLSPDGARQLGLNGQP